ncbi:hypothetical protein ACWEV4_33455 [Streptomyces sp. NPDC003860]
MNARTARELRTALASIALVVFTAATAFLVVLAVRAGPQHAPSEGKLSFLAACCALLAVSAAVDLVVLRRRSRREKRSG